MSQSVEPPLPEMISRRVGPIRECGLHLRRVPSLPGPNQYPYKPGPINALAPISAFALGGNLDRLSDRTGERTCCSGFKQANEIVHRRGRERRTRRIHDHGLP